MVARVALDFNSGLELDQARIMKGDLRCKHQFSKEIQSWVAKKITEKKDKEKHILDEIREIGRNQCNGCALVTLDLSNLVNDDGIDYSLSCFCSSSGLEIIFKLSLSPNMQPEPQF